MLKLGAKKESQRIVLCEASGDEPEAFIVMAPIEPSMRRRALRATRLMLERVGVSETTDLDGDLLGDAGEVVSRELIRLGAIEWGGIGETIDGEDVALPLTPDRETRMRTANAPDRPTGTIDQLLADEAIFARLDEEYVRPDAIRRAEKNGSSASPNGTGEAGMPAKTTAGSAARRRPGAAAKSAHTAKTPSRPKRAKAPGKS